MAFEYIEVFYMGFMTDSILVALERNLSNKIEMSELKIETKLAAINGQITLHKWMLATSIGLSVAILLKILIP